MFVGYALIPTQVNILKKPVKFGFGSDQKKKSLGLESFADYPCIQVLTMPSNSKTIILFFILMILLRKQ